MKQSVVLLCSLLFFAGPAFAADRNAGSLARDVVRMWDADIGDATILAFVRQHAGEVSFTADEVLMFRDAGMSGRVIRDLLDAASGASNSRRAYRLDSPAYYPSYYPTAYPWWYYGAPHFAIHLGGHPGGHYNQHYYGHDRLGHGYGHDSFAGDSFSRAHLTGGGGHVARPHGSRGHVSRSHGSGGQHGGAHSGGHSGGHGRH